MASFSGTGAGSPCGACKFLRRKCAAGCIFAPYFSCSEKGSARFAAIHRVFGASNVSKILLHMPAHARHEALVSIAYEAQARIRDPVHGCVARISTLQRQVASLQAQLMQVKAQQLANRAMSNSLSIENIESWQGNNTVSGLLEPYVAPNYPMFNVTNPVLSPQSSMESVDQQKNMEDDMYYINMREIIQSSRSEDSMHAPAAGCSRRKRSLMQMQQNSTTAAHDDLGELQALLHLPLE